MGICAAKEEDKEALAIHRQIEKELKIEAEAPVTVMKILLLGPGESGKSTVLKQMRIIHNNGFNESEKKSRRSAVYSNTVQSMIMLLTGMEQLGMELNPQRKDDATTVAQTVIKELDHDPLSEELAEAIKRLWGDKLVQEAYTRRSEYQLNDSAQYFFDAIDRIRVDTYIPTTQDILMTRVSTTGVQEITYTYKAINFRIFDVGGQKSERRKWIHCFDNVNAILFIVAISEYDQMMRENPIKNRMHDSIELFTDIINNGFFKSAQVILFMNKKDLFQEKIKRVPLNKCFPKYKGTGDDIHASNYIRRCFEKMKKDKEKTLYSHLTCATDTNQVQLVLNNATDMIISENFKQTGVM